MSSTETAFVETETNFGRFVRTFRGGVIVRDLIPDAPQMDPNADYYFPDDNTIVELKCLHTDPSNNDDLNRRFWSVCARLGYSTEQALRIALREIALPRDVALGVIAKSLDHVRRALRKANSQIAATKRQLDRANASGLVIFANEKNLALSPVELIRFMSTELRTTREGSYIDGVIYMTVNLYYPIGNDGIARALWIPGYRNKGTSRLTDFVDNLGTAWFKFREAADSNLAPTVMALNLPLSEYNMHPLPPIRTR